MEKYFTTEYKNHLLSIEVAEKNFKADPNKKTATIFSNLKNNPFNGEILTEEGRQVKRQAQLNSKIEMIELISIVRE